MNHDTEDFQLLHRFVADGSQEAFSKLVERHLNFVYAVCLREVRDAALAEDVTQAVFLILARKAPAIRHGVVLVGWLFKTARFAAKNAMRQEARRQAAEREVIEEMAQRANQEDCWQEIEPLLHEGIAGLGTQEREAVLLRYVKALLSNDGPPPAHLHEEAREAGWEDEQVLEAVAHVALNGFANLVTRAGNVPRDGSAEESRLLQAA